MGKPRALAVSELRRGRTGQKDAAEHASLLKNRLKLPFAKRLPMCESFGVTNVLNEYKWLI